MGESMEAAEMTSWKTRIIAICGMTMLWPSIHNQLMYPVTFIFNKDDAPSAYSFYFIYFALLLFTIVVIASNRKRIADVLFRSGGAMAFFGVLGSIGIALIVSGDFSTTASTLLVATGVSFVALYVPIHFIFWGVQLVNGEGRTVVVDAIASYILFCLITGLRLSLGIHAWPLSIAFSLVAAVLAFFAARNPQKRYSQKSEALHSLPLRIIIPSMVFIYLCSINIVVFNPTTALFTYPPNRALLYWVDAILFTAVAPVLIRNSGDDGKAFVKAFTGLSIYLMGAVLVAGLGSTELLSVGNFPIIAGKIAFEFFVWLLIIINSRNKHVSSILPAALYLLLAIAMPHFVSVCILQHGSALSLSPDTYVLLGTTIVSAFAVSAIVNIILICFLTKSGKGQELSSPSTDPLDGVYDRVQEALGLSTREMDIVRLACRNQNAKKIASELFIAESTVYTHLKRIYRKATVHSKQELIDLIEGFKAE